MCDDKGLKRNDIDSLERAILKALFDDIFTCEIVKESGLRASHFADQKHQRIFKAIEYLLVRDYPVDLITVPETMKMLGLLKPGTRRYISGLIDEAYDISAWTYITQHVQGIIGNAKSNELKDE